MMKTLAAAILVASALTTPFKNYDTIVANSGIARYSQISSQRTVKIAILDNGFSGREKAIGKSLPASTQYHAGPIAVDPKTEETHGTYMAQIVAGLLAKTPDVSYELHLYSAFGYTNLKTAIADVVAQNFDVVLYSQVWEYGGNSDGKGFINALVNQATQAGVIWLNASGNFGQNTYNAPIEILKDDWAYLPSPNSGVRVRCEDNPAKKCNLRAVLSWNDFKDDPAVGTTKDLDLVLTDDTLKVLRTGGLQQVEAGHDGAPGTSLYPREIVEAELTPGTYELRVKARSHNFTKAQDELRIVTSGDYIEQLDITNRQETLLAPADNASVITVGANDSEKSSVGASMGKPEVTLPSIAMLQNGDTFKGSSNSAAMAAALAVVARATNPSADRAAVIRFLEQTATPGSQTAPPSDSSDDDDGQGLSLQQLGFGPTDARGCFRAAILPQIPGPAQELFTRGAVSVATTAGFKIMTKEDPFTLGYGGQRTSPDDMLVVGPNGYRVYSRSVQLLLSPGTYEVVQLPRDSRFCEL